MYSSFASVVRDILAKGVRLGPCTRIGNVLASHLPLAASVAVVGGAYAAAVISASRGSNRISEMRSGREKTGTGTFPLAPRAFHAGGTRRLEA